MLWPLIDYLAGAQGANRQCLPRQHESDWLIQPYQPSIGKQHVLLETYKYCPNKQKEPKC
jgi:hypothetical protein